METLETTQEQLTSNTEMLEKHMYHLATVKHYLEDQLKQIEIAMKEIVDQTYDESN